MNENIVLLIDEPGTSLHINAQEELLNYFEELSKSKKQIIYTTHSPFMIDTKKISRVRLVEKVDGITKIHNKHYSDNLYGATKRETLSPLVQAMGASFPKLSPDLDRLNIITEGITDKYYINAMVDYLGIAEENKPFIIPCVGATKEDGIATILSGWGCSFKCLIDYDSEGYSAYKRLLKLVNLGLIDKEYIITVNSKVIDETDMKNKYNMEKIESLLSDEDNQKLSGDKSARALSFYEQVINGTFKPTVTTVKNFKKLFNSLGIIK